MATKNLFAALDTSKPKAKSKSSEKKPKAALEPTLSTADLEQAIFGGAPTGIQNWADTDSEHEEELLAASVEAEAEAAEAEDGWSKVNTGAKAAPAAAVVVPVPEPVVSEEEEEEDDFDEDDDLGVGLADAADDDQEDDVQDEDQKPARTSAAAKVPAEPERQLSKKGEESVDKADGEGKKKKKKDKKKIVEGGAEAPATTAAPGPPVKEETEEENGEPIDAEKARARMMAGKKKAETTKSKLAAAAAAEAKARKAKQGKKKDSTKFNQDSHRALEAQHPSPSPLGCASDYVEPIGSQRGIHSVTMPAMQLQTRSLTTQFKKYRAEARKALPSLGDRDADPLLPTLGSSIQDVEMGRAPQAEAKLVWVSKAEKIRSDFVSVKERITKLKGAHTKALVVTFNSDDESQSHVEALTRDIQLNFKRLDSEIKGIHGGKSNAGLSAEDLAVQEQVQQQLAQALLKLSIEFRQEQKRFLNNIESQKGLAAGSSLRALGLEDEPDTLASADPGFSQTQTAAVDISLAVAVERDEQISRIVETITELATLMRDLSTLVVEQGTVLDRIDRNIEKVAEDVEEGVQELVKAEKTQKSGRMMICIIAMIVIVAVLLSSDKNNASNIVTIAINGNRP
eukprot:gene20130-26861_t